MKKIIKSVMLVLIVAGVILGYLGFKEKILYNTIEAKENTIAKSNVIANETNNTSVKNETTTSTNSIEKSSNKKTNTDNTNTNTITTTKKSTNTENKKENTTNKNTTAKKENATSKQQVTKVSGKTIVIDPGHQRKGDNSKEPIGPGASETKAKVTTGATGVSTKQTESELNLKVSLLLRTELQKRGYTVIMTRTTQNVNISNSERAEIANKAHAAAFVRIHADSSTSYKAEGMSTLCQTSKNKFNGELADLSYKLSKTILDNMVKTTGAKNRGVTRTDSMSGINWAKVPTAIIEMGFLSNPEEDKLLASSDYQNKIVKGMANGIDEFIK